MLKIAGMLLVWLGCAGWGLRAAWELRRRTRLLEDLVNGLELLERELDLHYTPLPELLIQLSRRDTAEGKQLFKACSEMIKNGSSFTHSWEQAVRILALPERDRQLIGGLGQILGRFDVQGQIAAVGRVRTVLSQNIVKAREEQSVLGRVYSMLGVTAGGFLVILLL